jgi:glutaredoxin 2
MVVARASSTYRPRDAEHSVLHTVMREHLDRFLREVSDRGDGGGLPRFVEQEFREFLTCGVLPELRRRRFPVTCWSRASASPQS